MGPTIGDKIVETLYSNKVTSKNKTIDTPPPLLHSQLGCLLFSVGSLNSGTTMHGGDGEGKALFSPFKVNKTSESVSTNFVAVCSFRFGAVNKIIYEWTLSY